MREIGITGSIVLVIGLTGALYLFPFRGLLLAGTWMVIGGFAVGLPAGFIYHLQLWRTLKPRGELPAGWVWRPIELNKNLRSYDRVRVLTWCYLGALGFFAIVIGLVVFVMGIISGWSQGF
jgi:hypothetical protein